MLGQNLRKFPQKPQNTTSTVRNRLNLTIRSSSSEFKKLYESSAKFKGLIFALAVSILAIVNVAAAQDDSKGNSEFTLFSPSKGVWYTNSSDGCAFTAIRWGMATDRLVPADYDGDGTVDAAVWRRETGAWFIRRSSDAKAEIVKFGSGDRSSNDVPVPADYDGDGTADIALWRASTGEWLIRSLNKKSVGTFGVAGDIPVQADYDGDGKADIAVFRGSENRWLIQQSSDGRIRSEVFGRSGQDILVPADYTGDGKADIAVYRSGTWFVLNSETGETEPFVFGFADDIAAPGDYDDDGIADFAVFRKGTWYIYDSGKPRFRTVIFGNESDVPLNSASTKKSFSP